jgi:hypothetical protein
MRSHRPAEPHPLAERVVLFRDALHPDRSRLEGFVRRRYAAAYGARVESFLPSLMGLEDGLGELTGVIGHREGSSGAFFLEQYLDAPVETMLRRVFGRTVDRASVIEVGNLATAIRGGGRSLVSTLGVYLHERGAEWTVCTATRALRNAFAKLGIAMQPLARAEPSRLDGDASEWGRYYDTAPLVIAVHLPQLVAVCSEDEDLARSCSELWSEASRVAHAIGVAS